MSAATKEFLPVPIVVLEFSPAAFAMMEIVRRADGHSSVEEFIRANISGTVFAFCEDSNCIPDAATLRMSFNEPEEESI